MTLKTPITSPGYVVDESLSYPTARTPTTDTDQPVLVDAQIIYPFDYDGVDHKQHNGECAAEYGHSGYGRGMEHHV